jgi:hypothetical protein
VAITANEKLQAFAWRKRGIACLVKSMTRDTPFSTNESLQLFVGRDLRSIGAICFLQYVRLVYIDDARVPRPLRVAVSIDTFTDYNCWNFFTFRNSDLRSLITLLGIPTIVRFDNGAVMSGEETFLRFLYYLVSGEDHHTIAETVFGRDHSQQSRAWSWMVSFMYHRWSHILTGRLQWFEANGLLLESAEAIAQKLESLVGISYPEGPEICGFIDCNCLETTRVGSGPREAGSNATRWDPLFQRAFYNGWKSVHGLKHQTFDTAHGLTVDMHGPASLRRNDLRLLADSTLNDRLRDVHTTRKRTAFGDSIYPFLTNIRTYWPATIANRFRELENRGLKQTRIAIEWNYMTTSNLYGLLRNWDKLKVIGSANTAVVYTVATLLRNFHVCLYGCETSAYFNIILPPNMLQCYMSGANLR